jgi:hypothetical protein
VKVGIVRREREKREIGKRGKRREHAMERNRGGRRKDDR